MGMARGETHGDRGTPGARGDPVAALATFAATAYAEHGGPLRAFLLGSTRDPAAADDLVQDAFIRLMAESMAGRPPLYLRAWLFRVAANLAASRARRQVVAARRAPELLSRDVAPSPEDVLLDREAARSLSARLDSLPADVRAALLLSAHGYSGAEIARRIGRSELATRSLLCRQRSRLRDGTAPAA
jgi:RNA polymerase sigma-70 factor, ECF subfamily